MAGHNASQKAKSKSASQRKARPSTPDKLPIAQPDSRDELQATMSNHNNRRRKRQLPDSDTEVQESFSPTKAKKTHMSQNLHTASPKPNTKALPNSQKHLPASQKPSSAPQTSASQRHAPTQKPASASQKPSSAPQTSASQKHTPTQKPVSASQKASSSLHEHLSASQKTSSHKSSSRKAPTPKLSSTSQHRHPLNGHTAPKPSAAPDRSRSNSSTTLQADSQPKQSVQSVQFEKTEEEAYTELNILTRRYFLAYLSNRYIDEPVQTVFPGMKPSHHIYKEARARVQRMFKQWKTDILVAANKFQERYIATLRPSIHAEVASMETFKEVKAAIGKDYTPQWLDTVFKFGIEAVEFDLIRPEGLRFLKYAFLQLVTHQRMTELHSADPYNAKWLKYNRKHLIDMFDALHTKAGFSLNLENCPERNVPRSIQYKRPPKFDINDDSDASVIDSDIDPVVIPDDDPVETDDESLPSLSDIQGRGKVDTDTDGIEYGADLDEEEEDNSPDLNDEDMA